MLKIYSRQVLTRLFELWHEVQVFIDEHPIQLASKLHDFNLFQTLTYLSDIFLSINKLKAAPDLRFYLLLIKLELKKLSDSKQAQESHRI